MAENAYIDLVFGEESEVPPDIGLVSDFLRFLAIAYIYSRNAHSQLEEDFHKESIDKLAPFLADEAVRAINLEIDSISSKERKGTENMESGWLQLSVYPPFVHDRSQKHIDKVYSNLFDSYSLLANSSNRDLLELPRVMEVSFNSPFRVRVGGAILILASAVAICGGEIEFTAPEVSAKASLPGLIDTMERVYHVIYKRPDRLKTEQSNDLLGYSGRKPQIGSDD